MILDFDAYRSVVRASNGNKFILKPTIKVAGTLNKSIVHGIVTDDLSPETPIIGALVNAQVSDDHSARVVRSTLTDDGGTDINLEGNYQLLLSPNTSFNIVAFSEAKVLVDVDDSDADVEMMYSPACVEVDVPIDEDIQQNLKLSLSNFGNISGTVTVTANDVVIDPDDPPVVYISFFTNITECGYVEVATHPVYPDTEGKLSYLVDYSVDLPLGSYDVVASAEGFIPDTGHAALDTSGDTAVHLNIMEQPGS